MMARSYGFLISFFLTVLALSCVVADTITPIQPIRDGETIKSASKTFELGFFSFNSSAYRYVGIWYHKIPVQTVVWVANDENPVADFSGIFSIQNDGNLVVFDGEENVHWSTDASITSNYTCATLLDNGNLVLREGNSGAVLWQSFDHPSNTLLPGMKIRFNLKTGKSLMLRSWKNEHDPAPGMFSFGIDPQDSDQFFIWKQSVRYWRSGYWNRRTYNKTPEANNYFSFHFITGRVEDELYFEYSGMYSNTRLVMDTSGQLRCQTWHDDSKSWHVIWFQPRNWCSVYSSCGPYGFGCCNNHNAPLCKCMPGFEPTSLENWNLGNWSDGCARKAQLQCGNGDKFLSMGSIKVPDSEVSVVASTAEECRDHCMSNCSCSAYAYADITNDGPATCLVWFGRLMDAENLIRQWSNEGVLDFYVRVATFELSANKRNPLSLILIVSIVSGVLLVMTICYSMMIVKKEGHRQKRVNMSIFNSSTNPKAYNFLDPHQFGDGIESQDILVFNFESIEMATESFSNSNKLGRGGFGAVYKGTFQGGQEIAVKRLAYNSEQGLEEFKNEVTLIAKLQHQNLVRLLGYCMEGNEKLLVYEYMPNKSLDFLLFDQNQCMLLDWERRFNIILGIARGLLYLHQDSRLRIIHRDLKTSNILLDKDMNPKISDFGTARVFGGNQTQANTKRVIGTYGYMPPEYAINGHFSVKSDVFSFGVILLEIISGKKNSGFCDDEDSLSLLGHAWRLWNEDKGMDFVDPSLTNSLNMQQVMKCIQVGLLCVQEDPKIRPTMASVVVYLSDFTRLPEPELPAFYTGASRSTCSCNSTGSFSMHEVTTSLLDSW